MGAPLRRSHHKPPAASSTCARGNAAKENDRPLRRAASRCAGSSVKSGSEPAAIASSAAGETRTTRHRNILYSPNNDARRPGELLDDLDADSSTPTSTCSNSPAPSTMSRSGQRTSHHALTPLTSSDSSPPGKLPSPRSTKPSYETMHATTASSRGAPSSAPNNVANTITPVNTPPETRISVFPSDGVLGQRLTYDPVLDPKLDKKARQSRTPKYTSILDKVREGYT